MMPHGSKVERVVSIRRDIMRRICEGGAARDFRAPSRAYFRRA